METIPDPLALALQKEFNPLPAKITTPVKIFKLQTELRDYPDKTFSNQLIRYFQTGFDIGYSCPKFTNNSKNVRSADLYCKQITDNIIAELKEKRIPAPLAFPRRTLVTLESHPLALF